jgi:hypothetical protein
LVIVLISVRCFTCCGVILVNPKVTDGENEGFYAIVWGFCDLRVLMLCFGWFSEDVILNCPQFLDGLGKMGGRDKRCCASSCKHVQLYLIACLLSTDLGPSVCCIFLHVIIWMILSMQRPHNTSCLRFSPWNFHYKLFWWKLDLCCYLFGFVYYFHFNCFSSRLVSLRILNHMCCWEWRLNCKSLIGILMLPSCQTINLGNVLLNEDFSDPLHLWVSRIFF